ncbi:hypothetical protein BJ944DRAFT_82825 [Cunninghamella echinulata]|nr:hypothetical protein BJ944DRAFT_82825 [Cunninghamella echinulata]
MSFFIHSSIPWLHILKKWLLYGECEDPYHEFFIKDSKLIDTLLPNFITLQQAEIIFNTGIAMKKLSSTNEDHSEKTNHLQWWDNFINTNNDSNTNIRNMKLTTEWLNKQAPILTLLSNPNIEQSSLFLNTFKIWMQWQNENHVPPLSIIVHQQILNPITNWCQWSLSNDTSLPVTVKNGYDMNRHDLVFTFWDNHDAEYPYQYYVDEKCPPVNIATHLNCSS